MPRLDVKVKLILGYFWLVFTVEAMALMRKKKH
jgi:hypothetical protein